MNNEPMSKEEYIELMTNKVHESVDGKSVDVPVDFLYSLQMFLQASSHFEDEGKLPYPSFQFLAHDLSYKIREYTKDYVKFFPQDCYMRYDPLWEQYQKDTANDADQYIGE